MINVASIFVSGETIELLKITHSVYFCSLVAFTLPRLEEDGDGDVLISEGCFSNEHGRLE
jgi:hypothetical protein